MTSKVRISDIIRCTIKGVSEIPISKQKEGRIPAGTVVNRIQPGQKIDVIVLKNFPLLICDTSFEFDEDDILKRHTYKYTDISDDSFNNQRLALGTEFFKGLDPEDTIYLILH